MRHSERIAAIAPSPTVVLNNKAQALRAQGVEVLSFAVGEMDFASPAIAVDQAIRSLEAGKTKYGPAAGSPAFRQAIADKLLRENNLTYHPDQIVVGIGAKEILLHAMMALINPGDEVLVPAPYWVSYAAQVAAVGGKPIIVPMSDRFADHPLDPEHLQKYATDKTAGILINSPNNPTGYVLSEDQIKSLGSWLERKDWWIISDEIYEYMAFDHPHRSLLNVSPALSDRFFLVNGMSKGFAMTGWRVGYIAAPSHSVKLLKTLQSHSSTCLPPFVEDAATVAIGHGRSLLEDKFKILRKRRDAACEALDATPGITYLRPQGAFYIFIDIRPFLKATDRFGDHDSLAFSEFLLEEHHIAMVPGEGFGTPGFLRFSYATDENVIREGLGRLRRAVS